MIPKTIAILGAGERGNTFARLMREVSGLGRIVAVAEPSEGRRRAFAQEYAVPAAGVFSSWRAFADQAREWDGVIVTTMDREHAGPALACLNKGYDLLLEKPMATTVADCQAIERAQRSSGAMMSVCHSLRYHKAFAKVKELIDAGAIGRLMTIDLLEQVAFWHQAHSFVRGNWGNEGRSTFMLLAKSCHDIDYLCFLVGRPCLRVSSFGHLSYFRPENTPPEATVRCTDGCPIERECTYSAIRQYVDGNPTGWPASAVSADPSREARLEALRTGPYGRCVWKCDNDAVDHQVVSMEFEGDITATFTMTAFTRDGGRRLRVHGTHGELAFDEESITIKTFADKNTQRIDIAPEPGGHGGGDARVLQHWLLALHSRDPSGILADAQQSLRSHEIVFAAEESRRKGRMVEMLTCN